jgi:hypothetical protein
MMTIFHQKLPTGIKRALIVASAVWVTGYYVTHKEAVDFSWTAEWSTPSTMCSDIYAPGDDRLTQCEASAPMSPMSILERWQRQQRGEKVEVPFDYYQKAHENPSVWAWLFGVPAALFILSYALLWVREGFQQDK